MLHGVVLASHHSACKCATDVLFTPSRDLLAGIGQAMTGIGVTVMETGVTVMGTGVAVMGTGVTDAGTGLTVVGTWSDCGGDCCDESRDWSGCVTVAVIQIYLTGSAFVQGRHCKRTRQAGFMQQTVF